jgi:hypothetical protein
MAGEVNEIRDDSWKRNEFATFLRHPAGNYAVRRSQPAREEEKSSLVTADDARICA